MGNLKQLIAKVGMAWTIDFNNISLLAYDNNFSFQPIICSKLYLLCNLDSPFYSSQQLLVIQGIFRTL